MNVAYGLCARDEEIVNELMPLVKLNPPEDFQRA